MAFIVLPFPDFVALTRIVSAQVDANFASITAQVNGNLSDVNVVAAAGIQMSKIDWSGNQTIDGNITFTGNVLFGGSGAFDSVRIDSTGGAGIVTIIYANTAASWTYTVPDALANAQFVLTEGNQIVNGRKFFSEAVVPSIDPPYEDGTVHADAFCKGWANITSAGAINKSQNVSSVTHVGTGTYTVFWNTDFDSSNYAVTATSNSGLNIIRVTQAANAASVTIVDNTLTPVDEEFSIIAFGTLV